MTPLSAINPINPVMPVIKPINPAYIMLIPILLITGLVMKKAMEYTPDYKRDDFTTWCLIITEVVSALLFFRFGLTLATVKGIAFLVLAVFASVCDIKTRRVADAVSIMVALVGLSDVSVKQIFFNLISASCVLGFLLICACVIGQFGGADIKFSAASVFLLGLSKGIAGLMLGLLLSIIGTLIRNKIKKTNKQDLPLVPYLAVAFLITYFI